MTYRFLFITLFVTLLPVSFIAGESYYEKGRSDGSELAQHIYSLLVKKTICLRGGTDGTAALRDFLEREPKDTDRHAAIFKEFKAYYTGFHEAFTQLMNEELYQSAYLKPALKEWITTLYKMTCEICHSAMHADTFDAADRKQCALMKKNISSFLIHTRPALQLPTEDIVVPVPTSPFYLQGQITGRSLSLKLVQACAAYKHLSQIREEFLDRLQEPLINKDSSTEEHKQAFKDLKQFFVGLKEQFMGYTTSSVEATCRAHHLPENLIELCKLDHDYVSSTTELILGSSSMAQIMHVGTNLVRYYESLIMEYQVQQSSSFAHICELACSLEEILIFDELMEQQE